MDLRVRYRRSLLGIGWSVLNPVVMTAVFCVAFASWLGNGDWRQAAPYYLAGLAVWDFIKHSAVQGSLTFLRNEPYIRQSPLPLAVYTLRTSLGAGVHFCINLCVVLVASIILNDDHLAPIRSLWAVVLAAIFLAVFCWAVTAFCALTTVFFHDTQHLAEVGFGIFFFLTPIIYPKSLLTDRGLGVLLELNPVVVFLNTIRDPLLSGDAPDALMFAKAGLTSVAAVVLALAVFARWERRVIFHL